MRLSRGMQLRMLSLVVGLGFVLAAMDHLRKPQGVAAVNRLLHGAAPAGAMDEVVANSPPVISDKLLATINDNTFFRAQESEAWFAMLTHLQAASDGAPVSVSGPLSYAQLVRQPQAYRGRPVRIAGALRRAERVAAGKNQLGIESLYRLIIQGHGGEAWPITLYSIEPPAGVPLGADIDTPIDATGLFFKNWSYRYSGGLGISPAVLTRGVTLIEPPAAPRPAEPIAVWKTLAAASGLAAIVLLVVWRRIAWNSTPQPPTESLDFSHLAARADD